MPEILLPYSPDINSVKKDLSFIDVIESVDEVRYGGLSSSRRSYECNLLSRLRIKREISKNGMVLSVREHDIMEAYIASERYFAAAIFPDPSVILPFKRDSSLISLALHIYELEYSFCSSKGREEEIALLRELIDRSCRLPYEYKIACECAYCRDSRKCHVTTSKRHDCICQE